MTLALINTSTANIASVRYALERLQVPYEVVDTPDQARRASKLILPGVGAAGPAMAVLKEAGWDSALKTELRPILGICLGMQLLFEYSEESQVSMLGLIPGRVERLTPQEGLVWPHMGWNRLEELSSDEPLLDGIEAGDRVYFVHGFYVPVGAHTQAQTEYGADITAMARKDNVVGCQFHPERSSRVGARILQNFIKA